MGILYLTLHFCIVPMQQFLPRDAMRKRGLCCGPVSVCCPSVTLVHCIHTAEDIVKLLLSRPCSPITLQVSRNQGWKRLVSKMEGKTNFSRRL